PVPPLLLSPPFPYTTLFRSNHVHTTPRPTTRTHHAASSGTERLHPQQHRRHHRRGLRRVEHVPRQRTNSPYHLEQPLRPLLHPKDRKSTRLNSSHVSISYAV